jgi:hypothetical protein
MTYFSIQSSISFIFLDHEYEKHGVLQNCGSEQITLNCMTSFLTHYNSNTFRLFGAFRKETS